MADAPVDALYLSPHLDDVALSCPARLRDERAAGRRVVVLSVFTAGDASHEARKAEDQRALKILDVEWHHLELADAPFRDARYRSLSALCLRPELDDPKMPSEVERALAAELERHAPARVVAPFGVGGHVDHRLVHDAARKLVPAAQLELYEDRPYSLVAGATERRLRALGADVVTLARTAELRHFLAAPYVKSYLRTRDLVWLARHLRRSGVGPRATWTARIERHPATERGVAMMVGLAYASQWPELFRTLGEHERVLREASEALGAAYAERFWRVSE